MVEVTQEVRDLSAKIFDAYKAPNYAVLCREGSSIVDHLIVPQTVQAAFNAGRASVLAELESPTEAMVEAGRLWAHNCSPELDQQGVIAGVFTAMIGAYKEAL